MSEHMLSNPGLLWFIAGLALLLTELFAPSLILMFFGLGAWIVAALYLLFTIGLPAQLSVFAVSSILLLVFLRKKLKPVFLGYVSSKQTTGQNMDDFLGKEAVVLARIEPGKPGKVEFNGVAWDAVSDDSIDVDSRVRIIDRNGLKLKVMPF
ncbi:MAG: NfeD family protein [Deltaproteobacteria bacterium]|nr:NfeD family protein [Deltaproteobacteria bacterium]